MLLDGSVYDPDVSVVDGYAVDVVGADDSVVEEVSEGDVDEDGVE